MSDAPILYLGDTSLQSAACYLAGVMTAAGLPFDYLPSDQALSVQTASRPRRLYILSDYPSKMMSEAAQQQVLKQVRDHAAGLLMIGGWESFHGCGGNWDGTPIGKALPVEISAEDDRINCDQPALAIKARDHEIAGELPWLTRPPSIGGFNRVVAKPGSQTALLVQRLGVLCKAGRFEFTPHEQHPLLVLGSHGTGRTAAFMTDLAPHWVGGLVDWGDGGRVKAMAPRSTDIEVGNHYATLITNLLTWTGQLAPRA
jgi:hypothetical protein